ncbi:MAG: GNAT family N-acetyltransferase [Planctomycetota bacterium]|jgi:ribosomal protein S18 acetylase RimI-like enzyme
MTVRLRALRAEDRSWVVERTERLTGASYVVVGGRVHRPEELVGLVAVDDDRRLGHVTWQVDGEITEIVTLEATEPRVGVGTALIEGVEVAAGEAGCTLLRVVTTNDNLDALRFYQKRGFRLAEIRPGAVDRSRQIKPSIPETGLHGIPIRDEIELVKRLPR